MERFRNGKWNQEKIHLMNLYKFDKPSQNILNLGSPKSSIYLFKWLPISWTMKLTGTFPDLLLN